MGAPPSILTLIVSILSLFSISSYSLRVQKQGFRLPSATVAKRGIASMRRQIFNLCRTTRHPPAAVTNQANVNSLRACGGRGGRFPSNDILVCESSVTCNDESSISSLAAPHAFSTSTTLRPRKKSNSHQHTKWNTLWEALLNYKELHGNLAVPHKFVVPENDHKWPQNLWKLKLGEMVRNIRTVGIHIKTNPDRRAQLNEIGFVWDNYQFKFQKLLQALQTYESIHGNMEVPVYPHYVVPKGDERWPREFWGYFLGIRVRRIRANQEFLTPYQKEQLSNIGFVWKGTDVFFRKFFKSILLYKEKTGGLKVNRSFIVPPHDWPDDLHGFPLGEKIHQVKFKGLYIKDRPDRQEKLQNIGFPVPARYVPQPSKSDEASVSASIMSTLSS
mmetsp:Transcript_24312/g.33740  ORF Transcript_24312/g.33740 Transcript_24312/m.33740 type:complete len:388 (-) Transcript_24312:78-1241(-)